MELLRDPYSCPGGRAALRSFGELILLGSRDALDLRPEELEIGLQPLALPDDHDNVNRTHRVFIADGLDNGAGFAPEIAKEVNLRKVLDLYNWKHHPV